MKISDDTRLLLGILRRVYPWARFVSRGWSDLTRSVGTLWLRELAPSAPEIIPDTARCVELPPELLPEIPEGVAVSIATILSGDMGGWISVGDNLPVVPRVEGGLPEEDVSDYGVECIVCDGDGCVSCAAYWEKTGFEEEGVRFWMPMPKPPQRGGRDSELGRGE